MRRKAGEEALGIREQRLPCPRTRRGRRGARVGLVHGPEAVLAPAERPVTPEGTRAMAGEVIREQPRTPPQSFAASSLRASAWRGDEVSPALGVRPRNPYALQPRHGVLDHVRQGLGLQIEEPPERAESRLACPRARGLPPSRQRERKRSRRPADGPRGGTSRRRAEDAPLQRELLPQPPEGPGHRRRGQGAAPRARAMPESTSRRATRGPRAAPPYRGRAAAAGSSPHAPYRPEL